MIFWSDNKIIIEGTTKNYKQTNKIAIFSLYNILVDNNFSLIYPNTKEKITKFD
jgi:hypothetical protein